MCWLMRRDKGLSIALAAKQMGLSKSQLGHVLSGHAALKGNHERALQYLCGNRAITQFSAWELGCRLVEETWAQRYERRNGNRRAA